MKTKSIDAFITRKNRKEENEIYILMSQNTEVCKVNRGTGEVVVLSEDAMPLDLYLEEGPDADTFNNRQVFDWWCAKRMLTLDREYAKTILNSCGLRQATTDSERASIALQCKCLSLRDFFWVKKETETTEWDRVNLFNNHLSNAVVDVALLGKSLSVTNKQVVTELTTDGVFPKAWFRTTNGFVLYKGDKNGSVEREVKASQILRKLGLNVLEYWQSEYKGMKVSACNCFTNEGVGWVTAGDLNANWNLKTDCKEFWQMLLADYLVGNSDRHQDNWGYLISPKGIMGFTPLFDFNHAFEAFPDYKSLPEMLLGKDRTMFEAAREAVSKLEIVLEEVPGGDRYTKFVNERIQLLKE